MRRPTSSQEAYAWWSAAIAGERVEWREDEYHAGYYRRRFRKDGPWVPVEIRLVQVIDSETRELIEPERFEMSIGGGAWRRPFGATYLKPISFDVFEDLMRARGARPEMQATMARVDLSTTPVRLND